MKLTYLGTAAAEGIPAMFCACETCEKTRAAGGRNIRTRSQALVDDTLLIDFPPDTYHHIVQYGLNLMKVQHLLITHAHSDHLYSEDLYMRRKDFAHFPNGVTPPMTLYISASSFARMGYCWDADMAKYCNLHLQIIEPFVTYTVGEYQVTPLPADHDKGIEPMIFLIQKDAKTLLYANDTGYFTDGTWQYLETHTPHMDWVSLDCTGVREDYRRGHMGLQANRDVKQRLLEIGCAHDSTRFCVHHFSHNGKATYDETVELAKPDGFHVSYDTMQVEI